MKSTILEQREKINLRFSLVLNEFNNGDYNYSVVEETITSHMRLDVAVFDTIRKAKNEFNRQTKGWLIKA